MTNPRSFLTLSAPAVAVSALSKSLWASRLRGDVFSNATTSAYDQGLMTKAHFESMVNESFRVFLDNDGIATLRLRKVTYIPTQMISARAAAGLAGSASNARGGLVILVREAIQVICFQAHFDIRGPAFPQDSYVMEHGAMGCFAIHLVPGKPGVCTATFTSFGPAPVAVQAPGLSVLGLGSTFRSAN